MTELQTIHTAAIVLLEWSQVIVIMMMMMIMMTMMMMMMPGGDPASVW